MNFNKTEIDGVIVIEPKVVMDDRGCFMEEFRQKVFDHEVGHINFDSEYELEATQGHVSNPLLGNDGVTDPHATQDIPQVDQLASDSALPATLLRCVTGSALVTVTDERKDSPTRGQQLSIELGDSNHLLCFIPAASHTPSPSSPPKPFLSSAAKRVNNEESSRFPQQA